jgi:hypothetical protein
VPGKSVLHHAIHFGTVPADGLHAEEDAAHSLIEEGFGSAVLLPIVFERILLVLGGFQALIGNDTLGWRRPC